MLAESESGLEVGMLLTNLCLAKPGVQKALEPDPLSSVTLDRLLTPLSLSYFSSRISVGREGQGGESTGYFLTAITKYLTNQLKEGQARRGSQFEETQSIKARK